MAVTLSTEAQDYLQPLKPFVAVCDVHVTTSYSVGNDRPISRRISGRGEERRIISKLDWGEIDKVAEKFRKQREVSSKREEAIVSRCVDHGLERANTDFTRSFMGCYLIEKLEFIERDSSRFSKTITADRCLEKNVARRSEKSMLIPVGVSCEQAGIGFSTGGSFGEVSIYTDEEGVMVTGKVGRCTFSW